jgi:threonine dehydrogenase-like Zn-dependent dehydrogenase
MYVSSQVTSVDHLIDRVGTIDVVYEATGASRLSFEVLQQMGPNAAFVFAGVPGLRGPNPIDTDNIMRNMVLKNQVLLGTVNAGRDAFEAAIRDLEDFRAKWPQALRTLITAHHQPGHWRDALFAGDGIKHVIRFAS